MSPTVLEWVQRRARHVHRLWTAPWWVPPPTRRTRLRAIADYLIDDGWDDLADKHRWWPYAPEWGVLRRVFGLTCRVWGHDPIANDCGMPKHDYCQVCGNLTPGAAPRPDPEVRFHAR